MAGKTNFMEDAVLDYVFGAVDPSFPAAFYLGLFTAAPSDTGGGTECSGTDYARKSVTRNQTNFPAAVDGAMNLDVQTEFVAAGSGGWGTVTHFGIFNASTDGNLLYWDALAVEKVVAEGDIVRFNSGALTLTED